MKFQKIAKIFHADASGLPAHLVSHAQSPQAVVLQDRIRVFASGRSPLSADGYTSTLPFFIDFSLDFTRVLGTSTGVVMPLGGLGDFDEHGIFPFSPVKVGGSIFAYTTGWSRRSSVSVETAVGLAVSEDLGETFSRQGRGPILSASRDEPFLVCDAFVRLWAGHWFMWYIYGVRWITQDAGGPPERVYKIGQASSQDGLTWERRDHSIAPQLISDELGPNECQALPSVEYFKGRYHMVFSYREAVDFRRNPKMGYRLGYAWSNDLLEWTRDDSVVHFDSPVGSWDSQMQCYPSLVCIEDRLFVLYNGNDFGRYGFGLGELID